MRLQRQNNMQHKNQTPDFRFAWPPAQPGVCCIAGRWRRNKDLEIEVKRDRPTKIA